MPSKGPEADSAVRAGRHDDPGPRQGFEADAKRPVSGQGRFGLRGGKRAGTRSLCWQLPLHWITALGSSLLLLSAVSVLGWAAYRGSQRALLVVTDESVSHVSQNLEQRLQRVLEPADNQLRLLTYSQLGTARSLDTRLKVLPEIAEALDGNALIDALYAGYPSGEFILFRPLRGDAARQRFKAPSEAVTLVQTISLVGGGGGMRGEFRFYDRQRRLITTRYEPDYHYDPRTRPWFRSALVNEGMVLTEPYVFFTTRVVGTTLARRSASREAVIGMDATLETLVSQLGKLRVTPSTEIALVDAGERVLAYSDASKVVVRLQSGNVRLAQLAELGVPPLVRAAAASPLEGGSSISVSVGGRDWRVLSRRMSGTDRYPLRIVMAIPEDELFGRAREILRHQVLLALVVLLLSLPFGWWLTQRLTRPLQRLVDDAKAVEGFDFTPRPPVRSHIAEVDRLGRATHRMSTTISTFLDTSIALGSERRIERVLDTVLRNALNALGAQAGAVYFIEGAVLERAYAETLSGGAPFPERYDWDTDIEAPAVQAWRRRDLVAGRDGEAAVALETRDGALVGVMLMQLDPAQPLRISGSRPDPRAGFIRALSAQAAVAIETRKLLEQQKALLESFIRLVAAAIDAKSHYTGGHCQRVPELAKLLANAAHDAKTGAFAAFYLSEEDREALHIGAWLHDCGKVTTPEHVVDKATKLETICDRIHEVRMRFEVLKRDAEIASLRAIMGGADAACREAELARELRELDEDFAFVAECNLGGESMDPARIDRLRAIAGRTWTRTLDDTLGVSWNERQRRSVVALPVTEQLLADKPEHRIERPASERFDEHNEWGFRMDVPELKANLGELYNLSVPRGTLTLEDRYIINHHIIQTIVMLDTLPFPHELANVPEIAGGHHERMDGKGYPKRLKGEQMSVLARVMAIADVFEALTASDRPYKRPNTLSQAVMLMATMVAGQHLDRELFRLFLESGAYRVYGERYLSSEQCDHVDLAAAFAVAGG